MLDGLTSNPSLVLAFHCEDNLANRVLQPGGSVLCEPLEHVGLVIILLLVG